jgi:hypothetical protein
VTIFAFVVRQRKPYLFEIVDATMSPVGLERDLKSPGCQRNQTSRDERAKQKSAKAAATSAPDGWKGIVLGFHCIGSFTRLSPPMTGRSDTAPAGAANGRLPNAATRGATSVELLSILPRRRCLHHSQGTRAAAQRAGDVQ